MKLAKLASMVLRSIGRAVANGLMVALLCGSIVAQAAGPVNRATPPKFGKSVEEAFFPDAREKLVGPRPQRANVETSPAVTPEARVSPQPSGARSSWAQWISSEAVEDEIKTQQRNLADAVQNAPKFKAGDFRRARTALSVLATMFAIDAQYGESIRWQRQAPAMRDRMARAGFNCKVGTDNSFKEAKACRESLEDLIRGNTELDRESADASWDKVADRPPLMQRLDQAQKLVVMPAVANATEFARRADTLEHEAQIIAALAEVMTQGAYEFADDETYRQYAHDMRTQALVLRDACRERRYEAARAAVGEISKACSSCHEGYRN